MIDIFDTAGLEVGDPVQHHKALDALDCAESSIHRLIEHCGGLDNLPSDLEHWVRDDLAKIERILNETGFNYKHYETP